jgi:hypothetical protein
MNVVLDSCSLVNLINGDLVEEIIKIPNCNFLLGQIVYEECCEIESQKLIIDRAIELSKFKLVPDVDIDQFIQIKQKYQLGDGETESIVNCFNNDFILSSDDLKARQCAVKELGTDRVIGCLYLTRETARNNIITCDEALNAYLIMKVKGGFLPIVDDNYFCS